MAEEKTVTTTAVETGEKPEAAEGTTQEKPEAVAKTYDQAVQAQVEKRLAGKTPQGGNGSQSGTSMKSEIEKYMA